MKNPTRTSLVAVAVTLFAASADAERVEFKAKLTEAAERSQVDIDPERMLKIVSNFDRRDTDGDGIPDMRDSDIDGDGIVNREDPTPYGGFLRSAPPRLVKFYYDPKEGKLTCNGTEKEEKVPTSCPFDEAGSLRISRTGWQGGTALLTENGNITGGCRESLIPGAKDEYNLVNVCRPNDGGARQDATGKRLVDEWFTDLPWHQKLSTLHSNLIDIPFVMPFDALPREVCPSAVTPTEKARCMLQYGIVNVMAMHRTDTLYKPGETPEGQDCQGNACVEVKLEVQRVHTLTDDPLGYDADIIRNNAYSYGDPKAPTRVPSLGFAITEATIFAPWRPWYTGHYCAAYQDNVTDSVCYEDYFTTQLQAAADTAANKFWLKDYPALFIPPGTEPGYTRYCQSGKVSCSMFLGKVDWLKAATEPQVVGCDKNPPAPGADPLSTCQDEIMAKTKRLDDQFNDSIAKFADIGRYPWAETPVEDLGTAIATNPFIGYYELTRFSNNGGGDIPSSLFKAPRYVLPKQCTRMDFRNASQGDGEGIEHLKDCAINFEIHTSGFHEIWKELYGGETQNLNVEEIDKVLPGFAANQYGRTMFMFAGVAEQKIPVSFKLLDDGMSIHDKMYGSSMYTQYLPLVNPDDLTLKSKSYGNDFWHAFFMSNHMNQDPDHFIRGIRGRTLWHNEYRSNVMYKSGAVEHKDIGTPFEGILGHVDFPAGFQVANHQSPFHGNTCDSCHIRNGSGIPLMPNGELAQIHIDRGMNADFDISKQRDYTYTNQELPSMKMVLFDLKAVSERFEQCDANDHTTPKTTEHLRDRSYTNRIMNFYGNSFHVNQDDKLPTYTMAYVPITDDSGFEIVDKTPRQPLGSMAYQPQRVDISKIDTGTLCNEIADKPADVGSASWPVSCMDVSGDAISRAIADGEIGFLHLLGRRLGNTPLIEMIPDRAIMDTQRAQRDATTGIGYPGCYALAAGTRVGSGGATNYRSCASGRFGRTSNDCYISRWGWMGDRASLEDQVANAASVEMNITSKEGYGDVHPNPTRQDQLVRYNQTLCGPADASCKHSEANSDITEQEVKDMATYQRWIGIPQRSEYQVSSETVQRGEKIFNDLGCSNCHVIGKIAFVGDDNMLPDEERNNLKGLQLRSGGEPDYPFVSYLGTDLLLHDMGYLSQVAKSPGSQTIRNSNGTVKDGYRSYVQRIRTPALKGLRFNRFVTDSNHNTEMPLAKDVPAESIIPGCDFLLHDGRACDAIEATYLHDGPAVRQLGMIEALNKMPATQLQDLRAFLYSL